MQNNMHPKMPLRPWLKFKNDYYWDVKRANPNKSIEEIYDIINTIWERLPDDEKDIINEEYNEEWKIYNAFVASDISKPKRPTSPYLSFKNSIYHDVVKSNKSLSRSELELCIKEKWERLPTEVT